MALSEQTLLGATPPRRVALLRALPGLGDLLCSVPTWRALRAALPQAHLTLIGLPGAAPLVERFKPYLDELMILPGYPGLPEQPLDVRAVTCFLAQAQERHFDLALQLHGSGLITNQLCLLLGATLNAGFYPLEMFCPDPQRFLPYDPIASEVREPLRLLEFLGVPSQGDALEFPVYAEDKQALQSLLAAHQLRAGEYVCLHPGAQSVARRWDTANFARVADELAAKGLTVVFTGNQAERPVAEAVGQLMRAASVNLAGQTNLGTLAALLQASRLLVCNDTGVSHLAAALAVPSVVVFLVSEPQRWAPLDRELHRVVLQTAESSNVALETVLFQAKNLVRGSL